MILDLTNSHLFVSLLDIEFENEFSDFHNKCTYKPGDSSNYHKRMITFEEDYGENPSFQDYLKAIKE
jgi:hypothetical protein